MSSLYHESACKDLMIIKKDVGRETKIKALAENQPDDPRIRRYKQHVEEYLI